MVSNRGYIEQAQIKDAKAVSTHVARCIQRTHWFAHMRRIRMCTQCTHMARTSERIRIRRTYNAYNNQHMQQASMRTWHNTHVYGADNECTHTHRLHRAYISSPTEASGSAYTSYAYAADSAHIQVAHTAHAMCHAHTLIRHATVVLTPQ